MNVLGVHSSTEYISFWSCIFNLWTAISDILDLLQGLNGDSHSLLCFYNSNDLVSGIICEWVIVARTIGRFNFEVINTEVLLCTSIFLKDFGCTSK